MPLSIFSFLLMATIIVTIGSLNFDTLGDPDSYTRLTRVWHFLTHHSWFDNHFPYYNTPYGIELHWTKPLDFCLLLSMAVLSPFFPLKEALYFGSFLWNPLFLFGSAAALAWGIYPRLGAGAKRGAVLMGVLLIAQPTLMGNSGANRIDHHILCVFIACLCLAFAFRRRPSAMGIAMAMGVWVAIEFGLFAAFLLLPLYFFWSREEYRCLLFALASTLTASLFIERGPESLTFAAMNDVQRLSWVHVWLAWLAYISVYTGVYAGVVMRINWRSLLFSTLFSGCLFIAGTMAYFWLFDVSLTVVDPRIKSIWFNRVGEIKSAFPEGQFDPYILPIVSGAFLGLFLFWRSKLWFIEEKVILLPGLLISTLLVLYQRRHGYYLSPYVALTLGLWVIPRDSSPFSVKKIAPMLGMLLFPWVIMLPLLPFLSDRPETASHHIPDLIKAYRHLPPGTSIFAWPDLEATALPWHLGLRTLYAPYHQNVQGILDAHAIRHSDDPAVREAVFKKRGITHYAFVSSEKP